MVLYIYPHVVDFHGNVGRYTIHGCYGTCSIFVNAQSKSSIHGDMGDNQKIHLLVKRIQQSVPRPFWKNC